MSVNSALQRARATIAKEFPNGRPSANLAPNDRQRVLLERYVRAWEGADLDGFVTLLKEDAVLSMPPWRQWYLGREAIRAFFAWAVEWKPSEYLHSRLVAVAANRQPAFGHYYSSPEDPDYRAHAIAVVTLQEDTIAALTIFRDSQLFAVFGLPAVLLPKSNASG
jgi:RNA polymerase sigma-70 factor, ECF subfamily